MYCLYHVIENGKFKLYGVEKIKGKINLFPINNIYMKRVLSWKNKSPKRRNENESESKKIYDLFWNKNVVHSSMLIVILLV